MCLEIAKTAKRRVAKRDMIVYKSGLKKHKFIKDGVIGCITPYRTSTYIFGRKIKSKLKVDRFKLLHRQIQWQCVRSVKYHNSKRTKK